MSDICPFFSILDNYKPTALSLQSSSFNIVWEGGFWGFRG